MAARTCKLGLILPEDLHVAMLARASRGPPAHGGVQAAYAAAFEALLAALDSGAAVTFPAVRGRKIRVTLRLPETLCARIRARQAALTLKLTDFACLAVSRALDLAEGA